jgi:hypothetical protein
MTYTKKTFYIRYSLQKFDGINEYVGFILAEDQTDAMQQIRQISSDLKQDECIIDVCEEASNFDYDTDMYEVMK